MCRLISLKVGVWAWSEGLKAKRMKKSWISYGVCRRPILRKPYLSPRIELGVELHVFEKPRESSFQNILRIVIPSFLEEVTPVWVTGARSGKICEMVLRASTASYCSQISPRKHCELVLWERRSTFLCTNSQIKAATKINLLKKWFLKGKLDFSTPIDALTFNLYKYTTYWS